MKNAAGWTFIALAIALLESACGEAPSPTARGSAKDDGLVGAWRTRVNFSGGALAEVKDLEFMYVFNAGGTMTESSNYDGAPPVPPAYGTWKSSGPFQFDARYEFYVAKAPATFEEIAKGGGWLPNGHGVLVEKMTLSADGKSYRSTIVYTAFDQAGKPVAGGGEATGEGRRIGL